MKAVFRLKHNRRKHVVALIALLLTPALFSSCAPRESTTGSTGDLGKEKAKPVSEAEVDRALNAAAKQALGDREGAVLVMDPRNGRLRAVANQRLAFEQAYPPGSTIKSFTALTAMRGGLIDKESRILCPGRFSGESIDVVCSHPKSKTPFNLSQALAYSCNYFFATLSGRLSFDSFKSTLASAGLGAKTGVNAADSAGVLRDGDWRVRDLLGEGDNLLVTPIQLLTAYLALMNGGHVLRPRLSDDEKFVGEERSTLHIEPSQRGELVRGMRGAVVYGTAEKAGLDKLPLFIFGKTGTSASSSGFRRQGWFVSFAANANSVEEATPESLELAVLVFLKRSHGSDAAVVSKRVFEEYEIARRGETASLDDEGNTREAAGSTKRGERTVRVKILSEDRIATMSLEDYVLGVLSVEATLEDEFEALKAQAIVTRTYALKNLSRHAGEGFDLCSNTHCQQFIPAEGRASENIRRAVSATAGEVLRDSGKQLVDAYFHAACGGMTANIETLWGVRSPGYLRGVRDDYCATMPNRDWTDEIPSDRLLPALRGDPRTNPGRTINDIVVSKTDATGRAQTILIEGDRRRQVSGWEFKIIVGRVLGWNLLKSSRFKVDRRGSIFIFRGSGFGHGLGLCQSGAHVMARRGANSDQILDHYFPGTRVAGEINAKTHGRKDATIPSSAEGTMPTHWSQPWSFAALRPCGFALDQLSRSSDHFRLYYPASLDHREVQAALRRLEAARLDMLSRVGSATLSLPNTVDVVLHNTTSDFVSATGQPWWVAGVTHGSRIELQPLEVLRRRRILASTLRHEYVHAVIESIGHHQVARWLAEGLAIVFAGEGALLERFKPKRRLSLDALDLKLAHPRSAAEMRSLYAAAFVEVRALIQREGEPNVWRRVAARASSALT